MDNLNSDDRIPGSGASLVNALLGAWLVISPFVLSRMNGVPLRPQVTANDVVVGLVIAVTGFWAARTSSPRPNWVQAILGAWLVAAPILLGYHFNSGWNDMVVGGIVCLMGMVVAAQKSVVIGQRSPGV